MGFVLTVEGRLRQELRNYAVELRQLAYTLPSGVGENDLLRLSERMRAAGRLKSNGSRASHRR